jgi:beta-galactosidase/beta-glucuronidase
MVHPLHLTSLRPLVRYVDEDQAVIDAHLAAAFVPDESCPPNPVVDVVAEINGADGFHDEGHTRLRLVNGAASMRFEVVHPQRWWPAGMGEQPLYELTVHVISHDDLLDKKSVTFGLTSVRRDANRAALEAGREMLLLVNGQECDIASVIVVDRADERALLPATGRSLLLVRDYYGPDLLYDAADRAGILLVQCIPIHPDGRPEVDVEAQVDRLSAHPSLAGWFVGHLGQISDEVAKRIAELDPTRSVFRDFPVKPAA